MKFSNLSETKVTAQSTAILTFYDMPGEPWLRLRPIGEVNRPYFAAMLAKNSKNRNRLKAGKMNAETLSFNRKIDRGLIPKHADGAEWGGWLDESGAEVEYSAEGFAELCAQLEPDQFDEIRVFCGELSNFRDIEDMPDADDISDTAKN